MEKPAFLKSVIGTVGLCLIAAASVVYFIKPDWKLYCMIGGGVGVAALIAYVVLNFADVKAALSGRTTLYSANTVIAVVMVMAILVLLNFLSNRHHKRWDITEGKVHSLSDQSIKVLRKLTTDGRKVEINAFFQEGDAPQAKMKDLLEMYQAESRMVRVQFFDPAKNPGLAKRFNIEEYNTTVFTSDERETKIKGITEEEVTNALIQVSRDAHKNVYFLAGHGEASIEQADQNGYTVAKEQLEKQNYTVKKLELATAPSFPADCTVLVVAGPRVGITEPELKAIDEFLTRGGRVLFMVDPRTTSGLEKFLAPWGVTVGEDIIVDRVSRLFGGDELMPIITQYEEHDLTKNFEIMTAFPVARTVDAAGSSDRGATATVVGRTSDQSWAETDPRVAEFDPATDRRGPLPMFVSVTAEAKKEDEEPPAGDEGGKKLEEKAPQTRIVVFGDSEFPNNTYSASLGNMNLFLNTVAWLAEEEDLISIRPTTQTPKTVSLTREQAEWIKWSSLVFLPGAVLIVGMGVWSRRRNK